MNKANKREQTVEQLSKFLKKMLGDGLVENDKNHEWSLKKEKKVQFQHFFYLPTNVQRKY